MDRALDKTKEMTIPFEIRVPLCLDVVVAFGAEVCRAKQISFWKVNLKKAYSFII
jgi:hypothetical protein